MRAASVIFSIGVVSCTTPQQTRARLPAPPQVLASLKALPAEALENQAFIELLRRSPETTRDLGLDLDLGGGLLDDPSDAFLQDTQQIERDILSLLPDGVFRAYMQDRVDGQKFSDLDSRVGPSATSVVWQTELFLLGVAPGDVARLGDVAGKYESLGNVIERIARRGIVPAKSLIAATRSTLAHSPSIFYERITDETVRAQAKKTVDEHVAPAMKRLDERLAALERIAPEAIGVWQYPDGDAYYDYCLRHHSTTELDAETLHTLGISELEAIHAEMRALFAELGYPDTALAANLARATTQAGTVDSALSRYRQIIADAQTRSADLFLQLPQAEVEVIGAEDGGGYYVGSSLDGSRPGAFYAARGGAARIGMKTLAYHEAIPGHHLQVALSRELPIPLFQKAVFFTAFIEGWALYAEWLAKAHGWYEDDRLSDIGRLQAQAFRAARLTVDTGIHRKRWSLEQAAEFLADATGYPVGYARSEVIRYASWPGQAVAYYTGYLRFRELRAEAEAAGGFDEKLFHHALLKSGAMPLSLVRRD